MSPDPHEPGASDADRLRSLLDAHTSAGRARGGASELRSRLTSELVGSEVVLPEGVTVWRHKHGSSRELELVPYDGSVLVVHNVEAAGSSFLVHDEDGQPHARRGPAITLHRPDDLSHDELLVVFSADLG